MFGYHVKDPARDLSRDDRDSATFVPKSVVVDGAFDWGDDRPPRRPWHQTVIYEAHVKGFTMRHPGVPPELRGTYAGLASPAALEHLTALGVTAVELLPVHHHVDERALVARGLTNYWGFNPIAFFAPEARYSSTGSRGEQVTEFNRPRRGPRAPAPPGPPRALADHARAARRPGPLRRGAAPPCHLRPTLARTARVLTRHGATAILVFAWSDWRFG